MTRRLITLPAAALAAIAVSACGNPRIEGLGDQVETRSDPQPVDEYVANRAACGDTTQALLTAYQAVTGSCQVDGAAFVRDQSWVSLNYLVQGADFRHVVVTISDLPDDSVRSERHGFDLQRMADGTWAIVRAYYSWRCWPGRGHENYLPEPCAEPLAAILSV